MYTSHLFGTYLDASVNRHGTIIVAAVAACVNFNHTACRLPRERWPPSQITRIGTSNRVARGPVSSSSYVPSSSCSFPATMSAAATSIGETIRTRNVQLLVPPASKAIRALISDATWHARFTQRDCPVREDSLNGESITNISATQTSRGSGSGFESQGNYRLITMWDWVETAVNKLVFLSFPETLRS